MEIFTKLWSYATIDVAKWIVYPAFTWITIELVISTVIILTNHETSKEGLPDNWKRGYFKRLLLIGLFLLFYRTFLIILFDMFVEGDHSIIIINKIKKYFISYSWSAFGIFLTFVLGLSASGATINILTKFHPVRTAREKVYLVLLSIPIVHLTFILTAFAALGWH